jgi:hypothetical protein
VKADTHSSLDFVADALHAICVRVDEHAAALNRKIDKRFDALTTELRHDRQQQNRQHEAHGARITRLESGAGATAKPAGQRSY